MLKHFMAFVVAVALGSMMGAIFFEVLRYAYSLL